VSFRELFAAEPGARIADVMRKEIVTVSDDTDQEQLSRLFETHRFLALPVVRDRRRARGFAGLPGKKETDLSRTLREV
jgi:magnesium transporter